MRKSAIKAFNLLVILLAFECLLGCKPDNPAIKMKGSDTEVNLAVNLAEKFTQVDQTFNIAISGGGSGLGITSLLNGQADIANSSRPLSPEEVAQFKAKGIALHTVVFAEDATAFIVHKDLPLDEIDVETLGHILNGSIKNWSELIDVNLPINIYGRQSSSGTHSFIKKKLRIEFSNAAKEMTGNAQIIEGIKVDRSGIGYVGAGYVAHAPEDNRHVKILKIREKQAGPAISPIDPHAINARAYYFQRPLYQFVLTKSWGKVKPFIDFEKSMAGRQLIEQHGYYIIDNHEI
ncbi:PstS family phosphate ABC transporter substrate-binding protein [Sphingobacterium deserti]|uniref:Phosphate binding protein n=1 Tax=Sphingobacterium deserti TaxID=1229276 RepID=A0A0B8T2A8_9SPHI|nr:PstS family phosphate ABC transporter substrate-binding protein [Sphingobacterium deserti]KGE12953.1 phosphate binding protein [Sphingobacterium deserti]